VIAAARLDAAKPVERGVAPLSDRQEPVMSLETAQRFAWNLDCPLKVIIILSWRQLKDWFDGTVSERDLLVTPPARISTSMRLRAHA
jgi:hypothetical protein